MRECLERISKMPCITALLGNDLGEPCGCASCDAGRVLASQPKEGAPPHAFLQWSEKPDYKWCMAMVPDGLGFQRICRRTREEHGGETKE